MNKNVKMARAKISVNFLFKNPCANKKKNWQIKRKHFCGKKKSVG